MNMEVIKKGLNYLLADKGYYIIGLILINLITYIFRFTQYRSLTEFISSLEDDSSADSAGLNTILIIYFAKLFLVHCIFNTTYYYLEKYVTSRIRKIFNDIINRMIHYKIEFFKKNNNNKISQLWFYLNNIEILIEKLVLELPRIVAFLLYYTYTIYSFSTQSLLAILPINLLMVYILHPLSKKQYQYQQERLELDINTKNRLFETTSNIEFVKLNNKQEYEINKITTLYDKYIYNKINDKRITTCVSVISEIFDDILILVIYSFGAFYVLNNTMKPIQLLYLAIHTGNFYYQMIKLKDIYNYYQRVYPKLQIVYDIISYEDIEVVDRLAESKSPKALKQDHLSKSARVDRIAELKQDIIFKNIIFSYEKNKQVLNDVSFTFKHNKINVLLGPNGSGKSTLIKLLMRLYELDSENGSIYYNGTDIKDMNLSSLRKDIIFVSHDPPIFNDTIMNNIKYGNDDMEDYKIINMCRVLDCDRWVIENKDKVAGFRGRNLSGGEKKKVQLLNAICKKGDTIIFDEPSNALDSNAIKWFIDFVRKLKFKHYKTVIIITHDLRMIDVSDHIIDLNQLS